MFSPLSGGVVSTRGPTGGFRRGISYPDARCPGGIVFAGRGRQVNPRVVGDRESLMSVMADFDRVSATPGTGAVWHADDPSGPQPHYRREGSGGGQPVRWGRLPPASLRRPRADGEVQVQDPTPIQPDDGRWRRCLCFARYGPQLDSGNPTAPVLAASSTPAGSVQRRLQIICRSRPAPSGTPFSTPTTNCGSNTGSRPTASPAGRGDCGIRQVE